MRLLEHEAKRALVEAGISVPNGVFVRSVDAALDAYRRLEGGRVMVKAQTLDGGRGLRGLIQSASSEAEVIDAAARILQSDEDVRGLLVEEAITGPESYLAISVDTVAGELLAVASTFGGVSVEKELAGELGQQRMAQVNFLGQLESWHALKLAIEAGFPKEHHRGVGSLLQRASAFGKANDALLVEINPAIFNEGGQLVACDAKVEIDDSALWRQPATERIRARRPGIRKATQRSRLGVTYVPLDGDIGVISVGAGVGMAVLDTISYYGAQAGNFSDCTGSATVEAIDELASSVLKGAGRRGAPSAVVLYLMLQSMELSVVVAGLTNAMKRRKRTTRVFGVVWAAAAATKSMTADQGRQLLKSMDISMCESLDDAVTSAIAWAR